MSHRLLKRKDVLSEVFLGRKIRVMKSSDILKEGIEGIVENETKNMFMIIVGKNMKKIPKKEVIFEININGIYERIDGRKICYSLYDRIRKYA